MADRPARRIKFVRAQLIPSEGGRCNARVELKRLPSTMFVGMVEGPCNGNGAITSAAKATVSALVEAVGPKEVALELKGVETVEALGATAVFLAVNGKYRGETRLLTGFCSVGDDPSRAAALAVLNATNRFLDIG